MGHYCRICGNSKPNEKFSGKGHLDHICKKCMSKPREYRESIDHYNELYGYWLQKNISRKNIARIATLVESKNEEIAFAAGVLHTVGVHFPHKRKRIRRIIKSMPELMPKLERANFIISWIDKEAYEPRFFELNEIELWEEYSRN